VGKRDPFREPRQDSLDRDLAATNPLEKFAIDQFSLRAIIKDSAASHAMLEDPELRSHIVEEGAIIGREHGTISRILNTSIIITQKTFNYRGVETLYEKVLYLPQKEETSQMVDARTTARELTPRGGPPPQAPGNGLNIDEPPVVAPAPASGLTAPSGGSAAALPQGGPAPASMGASGAPDAATALSLPSGALSPSAAPGASAGAPPDPGAGIQPAAAPSVPAPPQP
jgi:hypothetical protein